MNIKPLFMIAGLGILAGLISVAIYNEKIKSQLPVAVSYNPYESGVYATGIVESRQTNGSNVNIYPQVSGNITQVFVKDGQSVKKNDPLFTVDDSVQHQIVIKDAAQVRYSYASYINVHQQLDKIKKSYAIDHKSISQNTYDNAVNSVKIALANLKVSIGQFKSDKALWDQYTVRAPIDGIILRVVVTNGSYSSPQGSYDAYTQSMLPAVQMGVVTPELQVRCYLDEILVPRLPDSSHLNATMFIRGLNNVSVPLQFVSIQPYTIPNIQLSDERSERVDVRVLPIVFQFVKPADINVFPGQLVDVFIQGKK